MDKALKNTTLHQIECRDLSLSYDGRTVLEGANFTVDSGDYLCIVGENGSGKSSLVKALLSLKRPSGGEIIFGKGLGKGQIGYLPQQTNIQRDFPATVREVVLSGRLGKGSFKPFYTAKDKNIAEMNIEKLGISDIASSCYRDLSGGQQQRVLLARALCAAEKIILLDEPVSGLDPIVTKEMYRIIEELNRLGGMTVIMVSHDFSAAVKYASKILHLDRSVKFFGTKEDYVKSPIFGRFAGGNEDD